MAKHYKIKSRYNRIQGSNKIIGADDDFYDDIDDSFSDTLDDIQDSVDDIQDSVDDTEEDDINIDIENNIDDHYIAECDRCHGIFISATIESDQDVIKVTGECPLCGEETDQYLKWVIKKVSHAVPDSKDPGTYMYNQ